MRVLLLLMLTACAGCACAGEDIDIGSGGRASASLRVEARIAQSGRVMLTITNPTAGGLVAHVERGAVLAGVRDRARLVVLRSARVEVAESGSAEMSLPAAALSAREFSGDQGFTFVEERVPALTALLDYFQNHDDVPAVTAQLLVLCFIEDVGLPAWKSFLARQRPTEDAASLPAAEDVTAAIDALGVLRRLAPDRRFALAADPELKLRALRNPACRTRAMQLYGLALPEVAPLPPELGTLLHTKPGDNCPICRQRALMQPREDGL